MDKTEAPHLSEDASGNRFLIYSGKDGLQPDMRRQGDTLWLTQARIAELFGRDKSVISRHISNILEEEELDTDAVVAKIATTAADGKTCQVDCYNLDMIISVGYRVSSKQAILFHRRVRSPIFTELRAKQSPASPMVKTGLTSAL